jgi:hypothetical protein
MREKVLERLILAIRHHLLHTLHVLAARLEQALEVFFSLLANGAGATLKMGKVALGDPFERRWGIGGLLGLTSLLVWGDRVSPKDAVVASP